MPYIYINNSKLYYEQHGTGDALVLLSGLAMHTEFWKPLLPLLSNKYKVLCIDNRGVGRTDVPTLSYTISDMTNDVIYLLDHLNIQQANFVGHSMGGFILQHLMLHHTKRIKKAWLFNSAASSPPRAIMRFQDSIDLLSLNIPLELLMRMIMPWLFGNEYLSDQARVHNTLANMLNDPLPQTKGGFIGQVEAIKNFDYRDKSYPTMDNVTIVAGHDDILLPPSCSEYLHKQIAGSKLVILPNIGHMPMMECPEIFISLLL